MKKGIWVLAGLVFVSMIAFSFEGFAEQVNLHKLYNAREELEYGYNAMLNRQEERNQKIQLQRYQQQEYLQQQELINQQNMYNQSHPGSGELKSWVNLGRD